MQIGASVPAELIVQSVTGKTPRTPTLDVYGLLQLAFDHYNEVLFKPAGQPLPACVITLQRQSRAYGYFVRKRFTEHHKGLVVDEIAMNPEYFAVVPLIETLQTLVHEMCHMWQYHFSNPPDRYHDKVWADKMESIGLMPSQTGRPGGKRTGQQMADYVMDGGPFMLATEALLKTNFRFNWRDTFPPARPPSETYIPPSWASLIPQEGDGGNPAGQAQDGVVAALYAPIPAASIAAAMLEEGLLCKPKMTRKKFVCDLCGAAVWGSPKLNLACLNHDSPVKLVAVDD